MTRGRTKPLEREPGIIARVVANPAGFTALAVLGFWLAIFLVQFFWTPHDPFAFHFRDRLQAPSATYLFGTDKFGRDVFSRVMVGSRDVIQIAFSGTLLAILLGLTIGLTAGFFGRLYDEAVMRLMDIIMSFPSLLLALLVVGVLGPGYVNVVLVIGIVFMPRVARVVRSIVMDISRKEFIDLAIVRGDGMVQIIAVEILPNVLGPLVVEAGVRFAYAMFLSASLGFLGLGVQPPSADWGLMVNEGRELIEVAPWVVFFPAAAIASLVVSVNVLSDVLRRVWLGEI
jgi:peptide/nickel transport system permease protein